MFTQKNLLILIIFLFAISACSSGSPMSTQREPTNSNIPASNPNSEEFVAEMPTTEPVESDDKPMAVGVPGVVDCDLINVRKFNEATNKDYELHARDERGCYYIEKLSNSYLSIFVSDQYSTNMRDDFLESRESRQTDCNEGFELCTAEWNSYPEGFQLGIQAAFGPLDKSLDGAGAITAKGITASGHTFGIIANDRETSSNLETSRKRMIALAEEVARQLNTMWQTGP